MTINIIDRWRPTKLSRSKNVRRCNAVRITWLKWRYKTFPMVTYGGCYRFWSTTKCRPRNMFYRKREKHHSSTINVLPFCKNSKSKIKRNFPPKWWAYNRMISIIETFFINQEISFEITVRKIFDWNIKTLTSSNL